MTDAYGQPVQVVRSLHAGEKLPCFSTVDLLLGVSVYVSTPTRQPGPPAGTVHDGILKTAKMRSEKAKVAAEEHYPTIKEMLLRSATNAEIAEATQLTVNQIRAATKKYEELKRLSRKRVGSRRGGEVIAARAKQRFEDQRGAICQMIEDRGIRATAREFKFCVNTLKRYLGEEDNA